MMTNARRGAAASLALAWICTTGVPAFVGAAEQKSAGAAHDAALAAGRATFKQFCAPCHGSNGSGDGPAAGVLLVMPTDLTRLRSSHGGTFPLATIEAMLLASTRNAIPAHGSEQMPLWGPFFLAVDGSVPSVRTRTANLVAFLESIQK